MKPIVMTVQIPIVSRVGFVGKKYRARSVTGPVNFDLDTTVHALRVIRYRKGDINQWTVKALAFIPERDRVHIPRADKGWESDELCWLNAQIDMNRKSRDSHVLAAFLASGDDEWRAQEKA